MVWIAVCVAVIALCLSLLLTRPVRIPREPEREGFQDAEASRAYDSTSRWPVYALERYMMIKALSREVSRGTLLDVGSGPGHLTAAVARRFPKLRCIGLDSNKSMLALARHNFGDRERLEYVLGDVERLPVADGSINLVISSLSLHHWSRPDLALNEIRRVLAADGRAILLDLRRDCPLWMLYGFRVGQALFLPAAIRRTNGAVGSIWASYTADELEAILAGSGLACTTVEAGFGWLTARATKP